MSEQTERPPPGRSWQDHVSRTNEASTRRGSSEGAGTPLPARPVYNGRRYREVRGMFNIGPEELLLILVIALVILGPQKLPDMARQIGRGLREFRNLSNNARQELPHNVN